MVLLFGPDAFWAFYRCPALTFSKLCCDFYNQIYCRASSGFSLQVSSDSNARARRGFSKGGGRAKRFSSKSTTPWAPWWLLSSLQVVKDLMSVGDGEVLVVIVVDLDHGRVDAGAEALDLADGEELVVGHAADADAKVFLAGRHDLVAASEPAGSCCANLNMVFANRVAHEHGVEGGHFVHSHAWHSDHLSHMVHGSDRQPAAYLPLSKVKQGDHCGSLVPVRVDRHDRVGAGFVLSCELKRSLGIVGSSVPVYHQSITSPGYSSSGQGSVSSPCQA